MKKYLLITAIALTAIACVDKKQTKAEVAALQKAIKDTANFTTIQWLDSSLNFGTVEAGKKVDVSFRFKNTGDKPLIIAEPRPSCGCTTSDYTKEPVAPGKEGWVKAIFNSEGKMGDISKSIIVESNTKNTPPTGSVLVFKGYVNNKEKMPTPIPVKTN